MTKKIKFTISLTELVYLVIKLSDEAPKGYIFNADKDKIVNSTLAADLLFLDKLGGKDDEINEKLIGYVKYLAGNVTPEYFKTLRSCVRSYRSRRAKQFDEKATSMTIDRRLQNNIKDFVEIFKEEGETLSQSEIVKKALDALVRERINKGKKVPKQS